MNNSKNLRKKQRAKQQEKQGKTVILGLSLIHI